ncbi:uncharacterized protein Z518_11056 [Rhinocladiella mackenziei CBS 650.93]|uniref:Uncharacterized protein n=1 Tax=Rhinocladiella mackenziei CBS 650.93 TaxID=1442369 RepID=A0A0D2I1M3_9EURO|nr:uncharacterized protein Z518_11056 [Rhinocladiella mackenziei CBS 650.93]KIW99643.1 hypothetical protein Z518_11056 [Rhinocladiella mackenziei CBS 650.93]
MKSIQIWLAFDLRRHDWTLTQTTTSALGKNERVNVGGNNFKTKSEDVELNEMWTEELKTRTAARTGTASGPNGDHEISYSSDNETRMGPELGDSQTCSVITQMRTGKISLRGTFTPSTRPTLTNANAAMAA